IIRTTSGGYIALGDRFYQNGFGMCIVNFDSNGNILWEKSTEELEHISATSIIQTFDGNYAISGYSDSIDSFGNGEFFIAKIDLYGNFLWNNTFGVQGHDIYGEALTQTADGGYVIVGEIYSDENETYSYNAICMKTDANGNLQWSKTYGEDFNYCLAIDVISLSDGYIIGGIVEEYNETSADSSESLWLIKTDLNGDLLWEKKYVSYDSCSFGSLIQTTTGKYVLAANFQSGGIHRGVVLIQTDAQGNILWNQTIIRSTVDDNYRFHATSLIQTLDGGCAIGGYGMTRQIIDEEDVNFFYQQSIIKTNAQGTLTWMKNYTDGLATVTHLLQDNDGGYVLIGYVAETDSSHIFINIVKTSVNGEVGIAWTSLTENNIILYRGESDPYWNYVRVRIWIAK
ncbi:MAG: hypothetical protein GX638_12690, partial [Crenarchaeota archaeon]|nr:hypothetical protein [Thermoproteota archaeon]